MHHHGRHCVRSDGDPGTIGEPRTIGEARTIGEPATIADPGTIGNSCGSRGTGHPWGIRGVGAPCDAFELHQEMGLSLGASVRTNPDEPPVSASRHRWTMTWDSFDVIGLDTRTRQGFEHIGHIVRRRRQRLGLSQRQLERLSGVDQTVISRLENGTLGGLRWSRFARLVGALGGLGKDDPLPAWKWRDQPVARRSLQF
jgi:hypothetical protein